ncbi:hypothetical protein GE061_001992 [Apolygus lucorum]|uniref:Reverse transcriptase n=1 Tax=Apolygus lucorum TaxID=248454 RepID=A0A8S9X3D8_APOLU|nr:hypothetical protein GE061_001992 [Apolygus lucorum]
MRSVACRSRNEHLYHVVQQCPRTHGGRILRHDAVAKQIAGVLSSSSWDVERERLYHMPSDQGKKPDIVAVKPDQSCIILDVQVVNGSLDMEQTWRAKIRKYDRDDLQHAVSELKGVAPNNIRVMAATLSWCRVWWGKSATELRELGISVGVLRVVKKAVVLDAAKSRHCGITTTELAIQVVTHAQSPFSDADGRHKRRGENSLITSQAFYQSIILNSLGA